MIPRSTTGAARQPRQAGGRFKRNLTMALLVLAFLLTPIGGAQASGTADERIAELLADTQPAPTEDPEDPATFAANRRVEIGYSG